MVRYILETQNSKPEELQSTELEHGPQSECLQQGRTCFFKCEFDFPQFHLKNSIFLLWVNCNNMLSCAKLWVSEEQRCFKVRVMRRKREIYLEIHLSPPLSLSVSWLPGEVQLFFFSSTVIRIVAAGPDKKREKTKLVGFTGSPSCESIRIHYFIVYAASDSGFVWEKPFCIPTPMRALQLCPGSSCSVWEVSLALTT